MTAESQLISGKTIRALFKRGFIPLLESAIDGAFAKRLFDVVFSLTILIVFAPVYLLLVVLIALSSRGPVFYIQERVGKNYKPFGCIKFRTMVRNADEVLIEMMETSPGLRQEFKSNFKLRRDPRITRIGRFLRITSLDEFPQFLNVLKGDMSVVGPRPVVTEELERYGKYADRVFSIRPGLTGLWQVSGRNQTSFIRRAELDIEYIQRWSIWMDIFILIKTIKVVLLREGAY